MVYDMPLEDEHISYPCVEIREPKKGKGKPKIHVHLAPYVFLDNLQLVKDDQGKYQLMCVWDEEDYLCQMALRELGVKK